MQTDKRKRRRGVIKKIRAKTRKYVITLSLLFVGTAILGVFISHFFSCDNNKTEKNFYVENEYVKDQNELYDKDANRVIKLAGEFFKKRIDEISKLSKK